MCAKNWYFLISFLASVNDQATGQSALHHHLWLRNSAPAQIILFSADVNVCLPMFLFI